MELEMGKAEKHSTKDLPLCKECRESVILPKLMVRQDQSQNLPRIRLLIPVLVLSSVQISVKVQYLIGMRS